jgi:hypothetical protein
MVVESEQFNSPTVFLPLTAMKSLVSADKSCFFSFRQVDAFRNCRFSSIALLVCYLHAQTDYLKQFKQL